MPRTGRPPGKTDLTHRPRHVPASHFRLSAACDDDLSPEEIDRLYRERLAETRRLRLFALDALPENP